MKVVWTKLAKEDLEAALHYISKDNPKAAKAVGARLLSALEAIKEHPHIGRPGKVEGTRELVLSGTPYIFVYSVRLDSIAIVSFLHSSRRWPPLS